MAFANLAANGTFEQEQESCEPLIVYTYTINGRGPKHEFDRQRAALDFARDNAFRGEVIRIYERVWSNARCASHLKVYEERYF
jgi:hypothetical protein